MRYHAASQLYSLPGMVSQQTVLPHGAVASRNSTQDIGCLATSYIYIWCLYLLMRQPHSIRYPVLPAAAEILPQERYGCCIERKKEEIVSVLSETGSFYLPSDASGTDLLHCVPLSSHVRHCYCL